MNNSVYESDDYETFAKKPTPPSKAMRSREIIIVSIVAVLLFVVGILIGHFGIPKKTESESVVEYLSTECTTTQFDEKWNTYRNKYLQDAVESSCNKETCNTEDLPRTYISYHLNGKTINIDGDLTDEAWEEVPWTETFMDIRGLDYPKPYFDTKVKVRWDHQRLYIGARMEETDFWGSIAQDETPVWKENSFLAYIVPDGSFHNYKDLQINARGASYDLMLKKAYIDFGIPCDNTSQAFDDSWNSDMKKATFSDLNNAGRFWTAEWSFSFERLAQDTDRSKSLPDTNETWFFNFARPQYKYKIVDGEYIKDESIPAEWWSWQPMYEIDLHLPNRYGLVQFKIDMNDKSFEWKKWHLYRALFEVFEAELKYKAINGMFTDEMTKLQLAPKIMSTSCVDISVTLSSDDFTVTAVSKLDKTLQQAHIRADRYVWFTDRA